MITMTVADYTVKTIKLTDEEYHCLERTEQILEDIFDSFGGYAELVDVGCAIRIPMSELPRIENVLCAFMTGYLWEVEEK